MYRAERFDVIFNVQMTREVREALSVGADEASMRVSDFARKLIELGLGVWRARRAPNIRNAGDA